MKRISGSGEMARMAILRRGLGWAVDRDLKVK